MTPERVRELLAGGSELRNVEFKGDISFDDKAMRAKVARAVLGLANTRDGGHVVVGVEEALEDHGRRVPRAVGLSPAHRPAWNPDTVRARLATYADPHVDVDVLDVHVDGHDLVVLRVHEFTETPVLCRQDANGPDNKPILQRGKLYVRPRGKPESVEPPSSAEMRDVLDLAAEKRLRAFLALAGRAGADLPAAAAAGRRAGYDAEWAELASPVVTKAKERGYWVVRIFPERYERARVRDIAELERLARQAEVSIRGWNFPTFLDKQPITRHNRWVGQEYDLGDHIEAFRFYASGQFMYIGAMWDDWRDVSMWSPAKPGWKPGVEIGIARVLFRAVEIYELAARLAVSPLGDDPMTVEAEVHGLEGRALVIDLPHRSGFSFPRVAQIPLFDHQETLARDQLVPRVEALALDFSRQLFQRFGYDAGVEQLRGMWEQTKR